MDFFMTYNPIETPIKGCNPEENILSFSLYKTLYIKLT